MSHTLKYGILYLGALVLLGYTLPAHAADKAAVVKTEANAVADLEERIAELEATVARKGNRKVRLVISGQINKAILWSSDGDNSDTGVQENSAAESYVSFTGEAAIYPNTRIGYVLQVGVGGYDEGSWNHADTNEIYLRQSYLYLDGRAGKFSLGHQSMATDAITEMTTANTAVAVRPLSLRPLNGPQFGEVADIFDGSRADAVRYDTPVLNGFMASAAWSNSDDDGDVWDIAARYVGEFSGLRLAAGVGYRSGVVIPTLAATKDSKVISGSASVMHIGTGVFLTAAAGKVEGLLGSPFDVKGWQFQGGLEERWIASGKTTIFAEFGKVKPDAFDVELQLMGAGVVQSFDQAALDLYLTYRRYEVDTPWVDPSFDVVVGGARIRF